MRGELRAIDGCHGDLRITPAYAGRTIKVFTAMVQGKDHPRVCGENIVAH